MTSAQKLIKYIALALSVLLIVAIFSGILKAAGGIISVLSNEKGNDTTIGNVSFRDLTNLITGTEVASLDIELEYAHLIIQRGDTFTAETSDESIKATYNVSKNKLTIKEPHRLFHSTEGATVIVYVPENTVFDEIEIDSGAGSIKAEDIKVKTLDLNLGAGKTEFLNLTVTENADIESGAGLIKIDGGAIKNLDLDAGVGKTEIKSKLLGKCDFDLGIGTTDIGILGSKNDYKIKTSTGIGTISMNGINLSNDSVIGDGTNEINISGGIGSTKITTNE